ncbi:MAG: prepilin-type N-terminal cleavage/methylation domain-containing protein [Syntrophobacteraceae bacterium]|nr:prepilin-type N-terminal cleavage/methylation domain-containing protein [Syntrophobacteraceae bacterium]
MSATGKTEAQGFTLIELLVVMSILAAVAGVGVFAVESLEGRRAEREGSRLVEWLKSIRREAMVNGQRYEIAVKQQVLVTRPPVSEFKPRYFKEVAIASREGAGRWNSLCFFPDGSACPGTLTLGKDGAQRVHVGWLGEIEGVLLP